MARPKVVGRNFPPQGKAREIKINEDAVKSKDKAIELPIPTGRGKVKGKRFISNEKPTPRDPLFLHGPGDIILLWRPFGWIDLWHALTQLLSLLWWPQALIPKFRQMERIRRQNSPFKSLSALLLFDFLISFCYLHLREKIFYVWWGESHFCVMPSLNIGFAYTFRF